MQACNKQTWKLNTAALLIAALTAAPALAQPTTAQTDAIKANCRSDYMKSCMSVPPGGQAAFDCLKRNMASLSPACQGAVNAIKPPAPAAAAPAPAPAPVAAPAPTPVAPAPTPTAVTPAPAPGRTAPAPRVALKPTTAAIAATAPAAAAVVAPPAPVMPTAEQQAAIKNTCRADFIRNCRGVQPGGPEALMCLQSNAAKLSPNCKTSVAAIADSIPPASAAAATTAPIAAPAKRTYATPGIHPAVRIGRRIRERIEDNR